MVQLQYLELSGDAENDSRCNCFLTNSFVFQGAQTPHSAAVYGTPSIGGFWMAHQGKFSFPFSFQISPTFSSSYKLLKSSKVHYLITG